MYSLSQERQSFLAFVKTIESDVNGCEIGVYDSQVELYKFSKATNNRQDASQLGTVAREAEELCSVQTDRGIDSLPGNVPKDLASQKNLERALQTIGVWADIEAVPAMGDLQQIAKNPNDSKALSSFNSTASTMNSFKTAIDSTFAAAAQRLGVEHFEGIGLPELI